MPIWLVLFFHLVSSLQPYQETKYHGLLGQSTPWDCGPTACAILFLLAGESTEPQLEAVEGRGVSLADLARYFHSRGWTVEGYKLTWDELHYFFTNSPNRPLLAHRDLELGHYVVLLGLVEGFLVVADPASGVRALPPRVFLEDFSGFILHFPELPPLSSVEKLLTSVERRLRLLNQAVAEF